MEFPSGRSGREAVDLDHGTKTSAGPPTLDVRPGKPRSVLSEHGAALCYSVYVAAVGSHMHQGLLIACDCHTQAVQT